MNRISFSGTIYTVGTEIRGFDFGGCPCSGYIVEYYAPGGWYAVRVNNYGDTGIIRVETAKAVSR